MKYCIPKIKEDFIKVIQHSQGIKEPKIDKLFDKWQSAKKEIIEAFGNKLIYEIEEPISFELSEQAKEARVSNFISFCWDHHLADLATFLENERDGFFKNRCNKDYANGIQKGTKLVKAFKYYVKDKNVLYDLQNKASQIIQENKIEGKLCFSVHPLDFLSISENASNWRSCHALDGEYRAGNLSYMMDESTIVCYLKSKDKDTKLPHFPEDVPWNNKKWRVLLYLSNDWKMIFAGKQYPFSTESGMQLLIDKFFNGFGRAYRKPSNRRNKYEKARWSSWIDNHLTRMETNNIRFEFYNDYVPLNDGVLKITDLVKDANGSKQFNDVLRSSCYTPMCSHLIEKDWWGDYSYSLTNSKKTRFNIGAYTYCLCCGEAETMDSGDSTMMCYDCEKEYGISDNGCFTFCNCCHEHILRDDCYYVEDEPYCNNCFYNVAKECDCCEDYYLKEHLSYNEKTEKYYCEWCRNNN